MNRYDMIGAGIHPGGGGARGGAPMQVSRPSGGGGFVRSSSFPTTFPSTFAPRYFRATRYYRPRYVIQVAAPSPGMVCGAAYLAWQGYAATKGADPVKVAILKRQFEQCLASATLSPYALPVGTLY